MNKYFLLLTTLLSSLFGANPSIPSSPSSCGPEPWLTGTLLAPVTTVPDMGTGIIQPYLLFRDNNGFYTAHWGSTSTPDFWIVNPLIFSCFSLTPWMDIEVSVQGTYQETAGHSYFNTGDAVAGFDFQLVDAKHPILPAIMLSLLETIPLGKYQNLNPELNLVDGTGFGAWISEATLTFYKLFCLKNGHYLSAAAAFSYGYAPAIPLHGNSVYGGGADTRGRLFFGNFFVTTLSFEYTLTQNWVLGLDTLYIHDNRDRFVGVSAESVGFPSLEQIQLTPQFEYNFSKDFGLVAGAWFTAAGRNNFRFRGGMISLYYTFKYD